MKEEKKEETFYKLKLPETALDFPKAFKAINCPSCSQGVPATNLSLDKEVAKCDSCNVVFSIATEIKELKEEKATEEEWKKPKGIDVFKYKNDIDFTIDQPTSGFDVLFSVYPLMFGALFVFLFIMGKIGLTLPIIFLVLSVFGVLNLVRKKHHKIHINVDSNRLDIQWRPKKFSSDKSFDISEIDQVYIKPFGSSAYVYLIINEIDGQKHVKLTTVGSMSIARFLEQQIERHLGIKNRVVPEEK